MADVLNRFPVDLYVDSGLAHTTRTYRDLENTLRDVGVERQRARAGDTFAVDDEITIRVIWPGGPRLQGTRSDLNSNSVVLRVEHGEDCFLLTGDMEEPTEHAILRHPLETCEVVKVAHHGSRHSSTLRLLERLEPQFALISAGAENRYGHPGEATLSRLEEVGAQVYRTDLTGHITLSSTGTGIQVIDGLDAEAPVEIALAVTEIQGEAGEGEAGEGEQVSPPADPAIVPPGEESAESEPSPEEAGNLRWWQRVRQRLTTR
jgi:beta-lactamase superfamily II metal-dependent hydrolase